jgi:hypothetical protein
VFSELPKPFDRNFTIAFFLPSALFTAANYGLLIFINIVKPPSFSDFNIIIETTVIGLLVWFGAVLLMATNHSLIRFLEGYGKFNPLRIFLFFQKRAYRHLVEELDAIDLSYEKNLKSQIPFSEEQIAKRDKIMLSLAQCFPDKEVFVLPTSFGNTIRSFEVYPRVMYGIEGIQGWERLRLLLTTEQMEIVNNAKSQVDLWLNIFFLSLLFITECGYFALSLTISNLWVTAIIGMLICFIAYFNAVDNIKAWGETIKGSFDVFLSDLHEKLSLSEGKDIEEYKQTWEKFSQAIIYRLPEVLPYKLKHDEGTKRK